MPRNKTIKVMTFTIAETSELVYNSATSLAGKTVTDYQVTVIKPDGCPANCLFSDYDGTEESKQATFQKALDFALHYLGQELGK